MKKFSKYVLLALLLVLAGCGGAAPQASQASPTSVKKSTPTPVPLKGNKVQFKTSDNMALEGTLYGQGKKAVICSNMIDGGEQDWEPLVRHLLSKNYMVLTYNYRSYRGFGDPALAQTPLDLEGAVSYVRGQGATTIILVGASMGGTVTAAVAAHTQDHIAALVALSGPLSVGALQVSDKELKAITAPGLFVNSNGDDYVEDTAHMFVMLTASKNIYLYPGGAHGTAIFDEYSKDLCERISDFFEQQITGLTA